MRAKWGAGPRQDGYLNPGFEEIRNIDDQLVFLGKGKLPAREQAGKMGTRLRGSREYPNERREPRLIRFLNGGSNPGGSILALFESGSGINQPGRGI